MPRPSKYVTRADLGWPETDASYADPRGGLVIHYDSSNRGLANKPHSACIAYWDWCRDFHMNTRHYVDVGYSDMACVHGYVLEGRGLYRQQAAQYGYNSSYYSVTLACGPDDEITDDQINAVRELRQWLMEETGSSGNTYGHRDFVQTSCPGDRAYALVQDGTFEQPPGAITEGEDPLIGLREGDGIPNPHQGVKAIQRLVVQAGQGDALKPYGVDGQWGSLLSHALMLVRQSVGSSVTTPIKVMNGETYGQLMVAMARDQVRRFAPACECDGTATSDGGTVDPQALKGATLTATVTEVQS